MDIANPTYNIIFKYLMNDSNIAKMFLSAIIGEKIVELDFQPKTLLCYGEEMYIDFPFYYVDFNAKVETETGELKTVIIDLFKDKYHLGLLKLKNSLATTYPNLDEMYYQGTVNGLQIYSIYLLDYSIGFPDSPLIQVLPQITELDTGKEVQTDDKFIQSLINHIEWIVQVPFFNGRRRTEAEEILNIFNQENLTDDDHILNIDEKQFSEKFHPIIRKLQEACTSKEIIKGMQAEDLYRIEMEIKDESLAEKNKEITELKETFRK